MTPTSRSKIIPIDRGASPPANPQRIVSLVPSITETLCEFGLAAYIVGVTDYCISPARALRGKARVGGPLNPSIKKILSLRPDIVFASDEENRKRDVAALERHGIRVYVAHVRSVAEAVGMLHDIAAMWPYLEKPQEIIYATETLCLKEGSDPRRATRVAYLLWKNPYMTCGGDTYINDLLLMCGGFNVFGLKKKRYFKLTLDALARAKPQLVLLSTEPYRFQKKDCAEKAGGLRDRGLKDFRVKIADGEMLSWYGARTRIALKELPGLLRG